MAWESCVARAPAWSQLTKGEEDGVILGRKAGSHKRGDVQQCSRVGKNPKVRPVVERATNEPDDLEEKTLQCSNPGNGRGRVRGEKLVLIVSVENAKSTTQAPVDSTSAKRSQIQPAGSNHLHGAE